MRNSVTHKEIAEMFQNAEVKIMHPFDNVTVCTWRFENGFTITEASGCINPDNYNETTGFMICKDHAVNKLWELEGYRAAWQNYEEKENQNG